MQSLSLPDRYFHEAARCWTEAKYRGSLHFCAGTSSEGKTAAFIEFLEKLIWKFQFRGRMVFNP